jgi:hypothetical protein
MTRMGAAAARQVANAVLSQYVDLPRRRFEDDEPRPPVDWLRAQLQAGEGLIGSYAPRSEADTPDGGASVRILAYFMPEASAP